MYKQRSAMVLGIGPVKFLLAERQQNPLIHLKTSLVKELAHPVQHLACFMSSHEAQGLQAWNLLGYLVQSVNTFLPQLLLLKSFGAWDMHGNVTLDFLQLLVAILAASLLVLHLLPVFQELLEKFKLNKQINKNLI